MENSMLIQLISQHPQALGSILENTPAWVWGLFAALLALGLGQTRSRSVGLPRMALVPLAMTSLSLWGTASAFGSSPLFGYVLLAWTTGAAITLGLTARLAPAADTRFDAASRRLHLPGSWVPLALIMGIFLTKYIVGVDLAMQPALAHDAPYALVVSGLYGLFSGIFVGRTVRLSRLVLRSGSAATSPASHFVNP
jgi:hypothetical protein